jgi:ATP-binding cassette subfamily F protein uup
VAEADWLRYGVTGRRKRNVRRLAALHALREARRSARRTEGSVKAGVVDAGLSGRLVIEADRVAKIFDDRPIVKDFSIRIARGDRIGVVGPNGTGKTTLVNLLTGALAPDSGTVKHGTNLEIASLEQGRDSLDPDATLAETLTGGHGDTVMVGGQAKHVVAYMGDFLFRPEQARTPLRVLSGGERARLLLARALARPANLLVLDEPTNDLDLETLDILEEMLADFAGTVLLISHDRDFLDRIVSAVIVPEGDGRWTEYAGGYADMLAQRGADLAGKLAKSAPRAPAGAKPRAEAAAAKPARRRLSFHDQHALATLPATIASLERKVAALQQQLTDPALYARDRAAFEQASAALAATQAELTTAEDRWLALELLKDELQ